MSGMMRRSLLATSLLSLVVTGCTMNERMPGSQPGDGKHPPAALHTNETRKSHVEATNENPIAGVPADEWPDQPSLNDYLRHAALHHPGLRATFERWRAALLKVRAADGLPDPRFTYSYYIREVETRVGPQRQGFQLSQTFPWIDTLRLRKEAAFHTAETQRLQYEAKKLALFYRVRKAYWDYYYLGRQTQITGDNLQLVEHLAEVVQTRYAGSRATHADLVLVQIHLGQLEQQLRDLEDLRAVAESRLREAAFLPPNVRLPWPDGPPPPQTLPPNETLLTLASQTNPDLGALQARTRQAERQVDLARMKRVPDVMLGLSWIQTGEAVGPMRPGDSGTDPLIASVSVNLPIWLNDIEDDIRSAEFQRNAAIGEAAGRARELAVEIAEQRYRLAEARRRIDLYEGTLIPKARESLEVTEASYRAGGASFTDLIEAQQRCLEFDLVYERARTDEAVAQARLEMILGRPLAELTAGASADESGPMALPAEPTPDGR